MPAVCDGISAGRGAGDDRAEPAGEGDEVEMGDETTGNNMKHSIVLLSGGIDSAMCLLMAIESGARVKAVWVDYGQPSNMAEYKAAFHLCRHLCVPLETVGITLGSTPMNTDTDGSRIVPHRNAMMITAAMAKSHGADEVWIGAIFADAPIYEDCREGYPQSLGDALGVQIRHLCRMLKSDVIRFVRERYPIDALTSCYEGTDCGRCHSCVERNEALRIANGDQAQP